MSKRRNIYTYKDVLLTVIKQYSIDNPIIGTPLADKIGLPYVSMRELAARLTCEGFHIGTDPGRGFYWVRTAAEMQPKIDHLRSRVAGTARHLNAAIKIQKLLRGGSSRTDAQMKLDFYSETGVSH